MKLSEVKQEFTRRTHMPAKKAFAELVVASGSLCDRRMNSTADWVWVLENMLPEWDKTVSSDQLAVTSRKLELLTSDNCQLRTECDRLRAEQNELIAELEQEEQRVAELEQQLATAQQKPADEAEAVAIAAVAASDEVAEKIIEGVLSLDFKSWYRKLAVHLHPDTTRSNKDAAQKLFGILSDKYNEIKEKENDECPSRILNKDEFDITEIPI